MTELLNTAERMASYSDFEIRMLLGVMQVRVSINILAQFLLWIGGFYIIGDSELALRRPSLRIQAGLILAPALIYSLVELRRLIRETNEISFRTPQGIARLRARHEKQLRAAARLRLNLKS